MLTIGQIAERAGVGVETIRFYERKGLIHRPRRPSSGFRRYDEEIARRVEFIRQLKSLSRIREALAAITRTCAGEGPTSECPILDALDGQSVRKRTKKGVQYAVEER